MSKQKISTPYREIRDKYDVNIESIEISYSVYDNSHIYYYITEYIDMYDLKSKFKIDSYGESQFKINIDPENKSDLETYMQLVSVVLRFKSLFLRIIFKQLLNYIKGIRDVKKKKEKE
jgi:hypothetical protein